MASQLSKAPLVYAHDNCQLFAPSSPCHELRKSQKPRSLASLSCFRERACAPGHVAMGHNLWPHFGVDEHPLATYFDVHQRYRHLTHSHVTKRPKRRSTKRRAPGASQLAPQTPAPWRWKARTGRLGAGAPVKLFAPARERAPSERRASSAWRLTRARSRPSRKTDASRSKRITSLDATAKEEQRKVKAFSASPWCFHVPKALSNALGA